MNKTQQILRRIRLELARDHEFPNGSSERGYDFLAPLDEQGHIDRDAWQELRTRCRVRRFWGGEPEEIGHLVHKRGNAWAFHYDVHGDAAHDESGFRFDRHSFIPGEYVSIKEQDGVLRTFRVKSVVELD
jgi:hypothetical protein